MYIERDIGKRLKKDRGSYIQILIGPRQCGKSTEFAVLGQGKFDEVTFDDLQMRLLAERDPALFLEQYPLLFLLMRSNMLQIFFQKSSKSSTK